MKINLKNIAFISFVLYCTIRNSLYVVGKYNYAIIFKVLSIVLLILSLSVILYYYKEKIRIKEILLAFFNFFNGIPYEAFEFNKIERNICIGFLFCNHSYKIRKKIFKILYKIILIISILSIIEYLYYQLGGRIKFTIVNTYKEDFGVYYYLGYFNSYLVGIKSNFFVKRLLSIYDEPGYFGTFLGIFILFLKEKNKLKLSIIYLAGILTLSTAFFYFLTMKILIENSSLKKIYKIILVFLLIFFLTGILYKKSENFNKNVLLKIEKLVENKSLNRVRESEMYRINEFKKNGNLLFGERKKFINDGGLSLWMKVYKKGFFGIFIEVLIFLNISNYIKLKNKKVRLMIIIALTSIFQRPNILDISTLICIYSGPTYYYLKINGE